MKQFIHHARFNRVAVVLIAACVAFGSWLKREAQIIALHTLLIAHNTLRASGLGGIAPLRMCVAEPESKAFETEVLDGMKGMRTKQDTLVANFENLQKETKAAIEELTKVKNNLNSLKEFETSLGKVQLQLRRETRMAYGDPVKRIQVDDELRARLNAAVRLACKDPAIRAIGQTIAKDLTQRTLTTGATPGSTLITTDLANEIYDTLASYGIWNTFDVQRVGTTLTKFPVSTARPIAKAVRKLSGRKLVEDETIAGTSDDCEVVLWGVLLGVERELLEDGEFDVTGYVMDNFAEAMALKLDELCLTADGTDDETDSGNSGVFATGTTATAAGGNTGVGTTDLDDWVNCLTTVDAGVLTRPCRWWMHPRNIARAALVRDLNGRPLFQTALEVPLGSIGSILGYPVTPSHAAPSTSAASAKIAAFGDPRAHVLGLRTDFGFDSSDDFAFDAVKRMFRGLARAGAKTRKATGIAILTLPAS